MKSENTLGDNLGKILSVSVAIGTYSMIMAIIALVGVVKEYHYVMIVMTVFGGLQFLANLFFMPGLHPISVLGAFFPTITGVYAYSIIQRNKVKQDSSEKNGQAFYQANAYSSNDFIKNKV